MDWKKLKELNKKNPVITGIIHDYHLFPDSPQSNTMQLKDPGTAVSIDMCHLNFNTNDNQRLGSVGAICRRSKCSCSSAMLFISFTRQKVKMCLIRLWVIEDCILCFPFIISGSVNECWLHNAEHVWIETWRLGLWFSLVTRKIMNRRIVLTPYKYKQSTA